MESRLIKITNAIMHSGIILLVFLVPLFFVPATTEFFEFNKLGLLFIVTLITTFVWAIRGLITGTMDLRRSAFDLPLIALFLIFAASTIFSDSRINSVLGQYLRFQPTVITLTSFLLIYYIAASTIRRVRENELDIAGWIVNALIASGLISGALALLHYFGIDIFGQVWSQERSFTPLGSPNNLTILMGTLFTLLTGRMLNRSVSSAKKIIYTLLLLIPGIMLILVNAIAGWAALAVGIVFLFYKAERRQIKNSLPFLVLLFAVFIIFALVNYLPRTRKGPLAVNYQKEITLDVVTSWQVAAGTIQNNVPKQTFIGSGPSTFTYDFNRYKTAQFNTRPLWFVRFDKPFNEYLLLLAEVGLLGFLAFLFLIYRIARMATSQRVGSSTSEVALWGVVLGIIAAWAFTYSTAMVMLIFFTSLGVLSALGRAPHEEAPKQESELARVFTVLFFIFSLLFLTGGLFGTYRSYAAEIAHRKAIVSARNQDGTAAYNSYAQAANHLPLRDSYHVSLSQVSLDLADILAGKENITDEDKNLIQQLVAQAINSAKQAVRRNPVSASNWENLANTYRRIMGIAEDANRWAVDSYFKAIALDPANPTLRVNLGGIYSTSKNYNEAIKQFERAVELKPNYANAYFNLSDAYEKSGNLDAAVQAMEITVKLVEGTDQQEVAQNKLNELKEKQEKQPAEEEDKAE